MQHRAQQHVPDACKEGEGTLCTFKEDEAFMNRLDAEVHRVNREFARATRRVIKEASHGGKGGEGSFLSACTQCCPGLCGTKLQPQAGTKDHDEALMERAEWCRRYAQINAVALRKIVKKHDKVCRCKAGTAYLQSVWSGQKRMIGTFLHSPMLDELKSLENILMEKVTGGAATPPARTVSVRLSDKIGELELVDLPMLPSLERNSSVSQCYERVSGSDAADGRERADPNADPSGNRGRAGELGLAEPRPPEGASEEVKKAFSANTAGINDILELRHISIASSHMADDDVDPEYVCPICLEAMYQPLGLECGHKFCADCAFSAVGKGNALGTVRAILDHVDPDAACPECRTKGVYVFAMELKETEKLIRQRYPKAWEERAADAKAKEARLRELLAVQRQKAHATFRTPF
ncbi:g6726 [Coccomyxa viridis]|uniref:RING-type E3 ubiquitin transferase n=1 Tax=Coccomyxa viridis TaxID=1274662 RepID=A0ABP1G2K4_9CHLO